MYHSGDDVLRVLVSRIADQPLGELLQERVFEPLAVVDSGLSVPESERDRFSTCYLPRTDSAESLTVRDEVDDRFTEDPIFPNSMMSTARDLMTFTRMLLDEGSFQGRRFLSPKSVALMMTDHLSDEQKLRSPAPERWWRTKGWGMGGTVFTRSPPQGPNAVSYSWYGGYGGHSIVDRSPPVRGEPPPSSSARNGRPPLSAPNR
jgi:CubicO group peptidase (beta-lactamase class C family)